MPKVQISTNIDIYCERCNAGLYNQTFAVDKRGGPAFYVEPCEHCLQKEYNAGYNKGYYASLARDDAKKEAP